MGEELSKVDDGERLQIIFSVVELTHKMRDAGFSKTAYSKILRETIHFVWEIREMPKHSKHRLRSKAAEGLPLSELDYDHAVPMRIVIEMIMNAWPDQEAVERILRDLVHGVLITKKEHEHLRSKKLASKMPDGWSGKDWSARYRTLSIELSFRKSGEVT